MQYNFGYSFPTWGRYRHACLKFSLFNIQIFNGLGLGWRWVSFQGVCLHCDQWCEFFFSSKHNYFQIRNHASLICFANPYNLKKLIEVDKLYEVPMKLNSLLRRDPDLAFVDYEDYKAILYILMVLF